VIACHAWVCHQSPLSVLAPCVLEERQKAPLAKQRMNYIACNHRHQDHNEVTCQQCIENANTDDTSQ